MLVNKCTSLKRDKRLFKHDDLNWLSYNFYNSLSLQAYILKYILSKVLYKYLFELLFLSVLFKNRSENICHTCKQSRVHCIMGYWPTCLLLTVGKENSKSNERFLMTDKERILHERTWIVELFRRRLCCNGVNGSHWETCQAW